MAKEAVVQRGISVRLACDVFTVSESCYRYEARRNAENARIADWLTRLTDNNRNWGFGLCYLYLRNVKGFHRGADFVVTPNICTQSTMMLSRGEQRSDGRGKLHLQPGSPYMGAAAGSQTRRSQGHRRDCQQDGSRDLGVVGQEAGLLPRELSSFCQVRCS